MPVISKPQQSPSSVTSDKPQQSNSVSQKPQQLLQKAAATKLSPATKPKPRLYNALAIDIRIVLAQNASELAIASSTSANITDANEQVIEPLPPGQAFQAVASNSTIASNNWQTPSAIWIEPYSSVIAGVGASYYW